MGRPVHTFACLLLGALANPVVAILYFALPDANNPGYLVVLGIFVVAFSVASASPSSCAHECPKFAAMRRPRR